MDFCQLIHTAQKNDKSNSSNGVRCYSTKFEPPKKEQKKKKDLSENIKKFLAKKEEEERKKNVEAIKKRDELLALRAQDKKATRRVNVMLKRTKSANQAVIEDAVDQDNTAVTLSGPMQPDEDDYGYVSQESSALYNKMMEKYSKMPDEPKFDMFKKKVSTNLSSTKDRVKAALEKERLEAMQPHKRKRKRKENGEEHEESEESAAKEEKSENHNQSKEKEKNEPLPKPKHRPAPPPINFADLLKIAEKKQFEPVVIEQKPKDDDKLLTKRQKKEQEREREWRDRREGKLPPPREPEKVSNTNPNRVPKTNPTEKPSSSAATREEKVQNRPSGDKLRAHLTNNAIDKPSSSKQSSFSSKPSSSSIQKSSSSASSSSHNRDASNRPSADVSRSNSIRDMDQRQKELLLKEARSKGSSNVENIRNNNISIRDIALKQKRPLEDIAVRQKQQTVLPKGNMVKPKQFPPPDVRPKMGDTRPKMGDSSRPKISNDTSRPKIMGDSKARMQENKTKIPDSKAKIANGRSSEAKPKQFPPAEVKPRQFPQPDVRSRPFPPGDVRPRQFPPPDVRRFAPQKKIPMGVKRGRILDDDDSEYDSELDDFIDDGPEGEEDYSTHIREIFGYDKSKYRAMDEDDVDNMESSFAQQMREEVISTKLGIMEDLEDIKMEEQEKKRKALMKKRKLK